MNFSECNHIEKKHFEGFEVNTSSYIEYLNEALATDKWKGKIEICDKGDIGWQKFDNKCDFITFMRCVEKYNVMFATALKFA